MNPNIQSGNSENRDLPPNKNFDDPINQPLSNKVEVENQVVSSPGLGKISNFKTGKSNKAVKTTKINSTIKKIPRPLPLIPTETLETKVSEERGEKKAIDRHAKITNYIGEETLHGTDEIDENPPDIAENKKQLEIALHRQEKITQKLKGLRSDLKVLKDKFPSEVLKEMPQQDRLEIQKQIKDAKQKVWEAKHEFDESFMVVAAIRSGINRLHPEIEGKKKPVPTVLKEPEKPKPALAKDDDGVFPMTPEAQLVKSKKDRKVFHFKLLEIENKLNNLHLEHDYASNSEQADIMKQIFELNKNKIEVSTEIIKLDNLITVLFSATKNSFEAERSFLQEDVAFCEINLQTALSTGDPEKIRTAQSKLDQANFNLAIFQTKLTSQIANLEADQQFAKKVGNEFKPNIVDVPAYNMPGTESSTSNVLSSESGLDQTKFEIKPGTESLAQTPEFKAEPQSLNEQNQSKNSEAKGETLGEELILKSDDDLTVVQESSIEESSIDTAEANVTESYSAEVPTNNDTTPLKEMEGASNQAQQLKSHSKTEISNPSKQHEVHVQKEPQILTKEYIKNREITLNDVKNTLKLDVEDCTEICEEFQLVLDDYVVDLKLVSQDLDQLPKELKLSIIGRSDPLELQNYPPDVQVLAEQALKKLQGLVQLFEILRSKEIETEHIVAHVESRARVLQQEWSFFEQKSDQIRELYPGNVIRKPPQLKEAETIKKDHYMSLEQAIAKFSELVIIQNAIERAQTEGGQYIVALNLAGQMAQHHTRGNILSEVGRNKEEQKSEINTAQRGSESGKGGSEGRTKDQGSGSGKGSDSQEKEGKQGKSSDQDDDGNGPNISGRNVRIVKVT